MNSFVTLLKREWLEHRTAFVLGPAILFAIAVLAGLVLASSDVHIDGSDMHDSERQELLDKLGKEGDERTGLETLAAHGLDVAGRTDEELSEAVGAFMAGVATPYHFIFMAIAFFGLVACMHDERKDHSILWWKTMPVSDTSTVLSKLIFIVWLAPIVTVVAVFLTQLYLLIISSLFIEDGMSGRVWLASEFWIYPFKLLLGYLVHGLWVLPVFTWVLLAAAALPKAPILLAVGIPWGIGLLEVVLFDTTYLGKWVMAHLKPAGLPILHGGPYSPLDVISQLQFWIGLVVAAGFIYATILVRGRTNAI